MCKSVGTETRMAAYRMSWHRGVGIAVIMPKDEGREEREHLLVRSPIEAINRDLVPKNIKASQLEDVDALQYIVAKHLGIRPFISSDRQRCECLAVLNADDGPTDEWPGDRKEWERVLMRDKLLSRANEWVSAFSEIERLGRKD